VKSIFVVSGRKETQMTARSRGGVGIMLLLLPQSQQRREGRKDGKVNCILDEICHPPDTLLSDGQLSDAEGQIAELLGTACSLHSQK
jgi:hypothetical protein